MQSLGVIALLLAVVAVGIGGFALTRERGDPADLAGRMDAVEDQLSRIEAQLSARARATAQAPTLMGHSFAEEADGPSRVTTAEEAAAEAVAAQARSAGATQDPDTGRTAEEIQEIVDKAVEKKTAQIQTMRIKKPSIDVFASTLQLTDEQREVVERDVVRAQHAIKDILEIPAEDGTLFMDELVEVMADGMANPGKNPGRGMKLFGRLLSETIPGSDETYAARVETVKGRLRASFKRSWSAQQYQTFETWKMDPSEVQGIEGSPWKAVERQVFDRARQLGAEIPDKDD